MSRLGGFAFYGNDSDVAAVGRLKEMLAGSFSQLAVPGKMQMTCQYGEDGAVVRADQIQKILRSGIG